MSAAPIAALFFTVVMLVTTAYFLMGSVPLLILKHGTPLDARFVRDFFDTFYRAAMVTASATAVSYVLAGRLILAGGATALALLAVLRAGKSFRRWTRSGHKSRTAKQALFRRFAAFTSPRSWSTWPSSSPTCGA